MTLEPAMAPFDRFRKIDDLPSRLPVFPLRGAILLPRATMPLNIFEPRYLDLVEDAITSDARMLGMIQPDRDAKDEESPAGKSFGLRRVGCAGRITAFQELDDGRYIVTLTGVCRFATTAEVANDRIYRAFDVRYDEFAADLVQGLGEDKIDRPTLLGALKRYLDARKLKADWNAITTAPSEYLINMLSIVSPYGPEEKQALLEAADLKTRAEVLVALAEMELASGESGSGSTLQ